MQERAIRTPIGVMWLDDDGILWHRIDALSVTADDAAAVKQAVARLTEGRLVPAVIDIRSVAFAEADARRAFAGSPEESHELATALIVGPAASQTMAKAFANVTKPARPVGVFTTEDAALAWLRDVVPGPEAGG